MADDPNAPAVDDENLALTRRINELNQQVANKTHAEVQARVADEQLEEKRRKIKELEAKLLEPPEKREYAELKTDGLDEDSAKVLRRIFVLDAGKTWTPERAQMLVDKMVSIPASERSVAAQELLDQIASGELDGKLDFASVMGGAGGVFDNPRLTAKQTVNNLMKQLESMPPEARAKAQKEIASTLKKGAKKIQGMSSGKSSTKGVTGPKHEEVEDDGPGHGMPEGGDGSPWSAYD